MFVCFNLTWSFLTLLHVWFFQARSHINATYRPVDGGLLDQMSSPGTYESTPGPNLSDVRSVIEALLGLTIWPCTWNAMTPRTNDELLESSTLRLEHTPSGLLLACEPVEGRDVKKSEINKCLWFVSQSACLLHPSQFWRLTAIIIAQSTSVLLKWTYYP